MMSIQIIRRWSAPLQHYDYGLNMHWTNKIEIKLVFRKRHWSVHQLNRFVLNLRWKKKTQQDYKNHLRKKKLTIFWHFSKNISKIRFIKGLLRFFLYKVTDIKSMVDASMVLSGPILVSFISNEQQKRLLINKIHKTAFAK